MEVCVMMATEVSAGAAQKIEEKLVGNSSDLFVSVAVINSSPFIPFT